MSSVTDGGKSYLAQHIVELMPPRCKNPNAPAADDHGYLNYVEPYAGGLSVLFANDPEGIAEIVNDLDAELTTFWRVLQDDALFSRFQRLVYAVPVSQYEFKMASIGEQHQEGKDPLEICQVNVAARFFIRNRQSRQGLEKCFATLTRNRTRRGMNEQASAWLSAIEGLPEFHARLKRVVILNDDAVKVIKQQDGPRTLIYADPPYPTSTRSTGGGEYKHEMTDAQHKELLDTLASIKGRFILSGYHHTLYDSMARENGWRCVEVEIDNKSSGAKVKEKKIECLWMNY